MIHLPGFIESLYLKLTFRVYYNLKAESQHEVMKEF